MIPLVRPADFELAKAVSEIESGFGLVLPMGGGRDFMDKAEKLGFAQPSFYRANTWFKRLVGLEAAPTEIHTRIVLSSRAAFAWLSKFGDLYCNDKYRDHPLSRDGLKTRYDVDRFESDYYQWMNKRFKQGDMLAKEPLFTDMVYPAASQI